MGLPGLKVRVLVGSVHSGGTRRKSAAFFALKSSWRPPAWLGLWSLLLPSELSKVTIVLTLHLSPLLFCLSYFFKNPGDYIGSTQVIQCNLRILRSVD